MQIDQPANKKPKTSATIAIGCASLFYLCCCCAFANYLFNPLPPTPTPAAQIDPFETIIEATYSAARTQTAIIEYLPLSTATLAPLIETNPTATIRIFEIQTNAVSPTEYIYATNTPFALATQQLQATSPSTASCEPAYPDVCINGKPRLNCDQLRAKGIFHFRVLQPDPLDYDKDKDGIGCE